VAELQPEAPAVEVGKGDEEVGHGAVFAEEKIGETSGRFAGVVHSANVSRDFTPSPNARGWRMERFPVRASRTLAGKPPRTAAGTRGVEDGLLCANSKPHRETR
jgi:hypothetical protein